MRTEQEIREMLERLQRLNNGIAKQLASRTCNGEEFDNIATVFNHNSQMICALEWVMGKETIEVKSA